MSPLAMRLPSVLAGILTWWLLSRGALPVLLPHCARTLGLRALAAVSLLAWWMPYCLGVRPEAFAALGVTATFALVLRGTRRRDGSGLLMLGLGALAAGLSLAVSPVGLPALAPIIALSPQIVRTLRSGGSWLVSWIAVGACLASTGVVVMFADQSWFGVRTANELHRYYGPDVPWFQEIRRYEYLLGFDLQGDVGRRVPVLLTVAALVCATLMLARGARQLPGMRLAYVPGVCLAVGLVLLWPTPSKWTHYFGALAGVGAATLACSVVLLLVLARNSGPVRAVVLIGLGGTSLAVLAASVAFSGKNNWFLYSQFGVPWGTQPVRPLNNPLPWLALVGVLVGTALLRDRRHGVARMLVRMPAVIAVVSVVGSIAVLLFSFAVAPIDQRDSYSMGQQNLDSIRGSSCGIEDKIVVTPEESATPLRPSGRGQDNALGFARGGGHPPGIGVPPSADNVWGSLTGGPLSTGGLTTRWFSLPPLQQDQELAVSVAGRTGDGNYFALEFARAGRPVGQRILDDAYMDADERPTYPTEHVIEDEPQDHPSWRTLRVDPGGIPAGADEVRVKALDATSDPAGWIATTGPRIRQVMGLREFLRDRGPTYVDWSMAWSFPCVRDLPRVGDGLVEPPSVLISAPSGLGFGGTAAFVEGIGGSFLGVSEIGEQTEVPTRLLGTDDKPDYAEWGHLILVEYPVTRDVYSVRTNPRWRWGWRGPE
jgi:arabinosyltransferase C